MESLPRGSETAEQRRISERTRSQHRRSVETNEQTAVRLSAQRDRGRQRRSCETLEHADRRPLLIAVGHSVVALLKLLTRPRCTRRSSRDFL